ncbi:NAD-dependent epimerase/dehydratase family protein [Agrobacterium tumefaciens]|uniref:NAD-dependent epimerase/dehydratase family protein n=1 Tax=Agrobacterium tumefaciens TaxID=358 RepID=UPI0021D1B432|nr:NAD(P)-dependent oxidoreductase [Agrobacterium tumefaciens]
MNRFNIRSDFFQGARFLARYEQKGDFIVRDTILIFGGAGFVGTHLLRSLSEQNNFDLVSVDKKDATSKIAGVTYIKHDVRDLSSFSIERNIARIYNLAAVHTTPGHPTHEYYDTNVSGALEITKFAERHNVPELVFTSSISVYGPAEDRKTEETTPRPESAYGYSKLLAEKVHEDWLRRAPEERKLTVVRPAVVFGPGEGGNFTRLASLLKRGMFVYPGRKDTIKACIYISDLLGALEFARQQQQNYVLFNAAYPGRYTLEQIVETLIDKHFPTAKTFLVPRYLLTSAAKLLGSMDAFNLGVHPDRVLKLVRSTDVYPNWLDRNGYPFPNSLPEVFDRWSRETNGSFV